MATKLGSRKLLRSTPQTHSLISSVREFLPLAACTPPRTAAVVRPHSLHAGGGQKPSPTIAILASCSISGG